MAASRPARPLSLVREGYLAVATLRRPPENLVDRSLAAEIREVCGRLREEGEVRLLILAAEGEAFCRGTDPSLLAEAPDAGGVAGAAVLLDAYRCANALASLPFPVLAAIEGDAFDQGLEMALATDLRIAGASARFRMGQLSQGLIPWDGGTQRLPRTVGMPNATDLILTGRAVDAAEAERIGLVNRVVPAGQALTATREMAQGILAGGPIAARYAKEVVHTGMDMTLDHGILLETDLSMILQTTSDRAEGIRSFLERRRPQFKGE